MSFQRRLFLFIAGILLGAIVVYFSLVANKSDGYFSDWLPSNRVLIKVRSTPVVFTDEANTQLACYGVTTNDVLIVLKDYAEVDFSKSNVHDQSYPEYYLQTNNTATKIQTVYLKMENIGAEKTHRVIIQKLTFHPTLSTACL